MDEQIKQVYELIKRSKHIVFFGGAGVSTESGIPDFRSENGLYSKTNEKFTEFPPEYYLSRECLLKHPQQFFEFIRFMKDTREYEPNTTHKVLAKMEQAGKLQAIITQNIDRLHQKAGSTNVIEIHGNAQASFCEDCGRPYPYNHIFECNEKIPKCECGGILRPKITLYGEELPEKEYLNAVLEMRKADLLIIGGTSLSVYPAATLIKFFKGENIVVINKNINEVYAPDGVLFIENSLGKVFEQICELMESEMTTV